MLQYNLRTLAAFFFLSCMALSPLEASELLNAKKGQVAVKGYDVVAYFTEGRPVRGTPEQEYVWRDVRWQFSSQDNLEKFATEPSRYAPRYGGFCAGGMALGRRAPIDPEAFVIVDGKLYLNYDKATALEFEASAEGSIAKADANWQQMNTD